MRLLHLACRLHCIVCSDCSKDDIVIQSFTAQLVTKIHVFIFHFNSSTRFPGNGGITLVHIHELTSWLFCAF